MASTAGRTPSNMFATLQTGAAGWGGALEARLEAERGQLPLWLPVALGAGVTAWLAIPGATGWRAALLAAVALATALLAMGRGGRASAWAATLALSFALGLGLAWWRAERVAAPVLARPAIATVVGRVENVQPLPARELVRLRLSGLRWIADTGSSGRVVEPAPARIRVNVAQGDLPAGVTRGALVRLRARLMPPPPPPVPGAYDFARTAWFEGLGATGRAFASITVLSPGESENGLRARLTTHIQRRLEGSAGGVAAALATGDVGGISESDAEAMRRAGLAHLLSVSGLHVTAAVGLVMTLLLRLLALSPRLALTGRVPLLAAAGGALAAIGYTWLTGAQVPTVRSCIAALLVLAALALGREAVTLRLVAAGALLVLLLWPESLAGASFQLSFAAVTAIVALHESPRVRGWFAPRDDPRWRSILRGGASLLLTGVVVELALMPIAAWHFHKAGVYGALANIVAIPLTTFVVMPAEALALLLDPIGVSAPLWWFAGGALHALLWLANSVAAMPGAVTSIPVMPAGAFALMVAGGLWLALWRTRWRHWGMMPIAAGAVWTLTTPAPDLIVTGDGRHLAVRTVSGLAVLRDRTGDYVSDALTESGGIDGAPLLLSRDAAARCNRDLCWITGASAGRSWRVLATRSTYLLPTADLSSLCRAADIVVSERRLPRRCRARWLTLDRATLARTGGVTVTFADGTIRTVKTDADAHPWRAMKPAEYPVATRRLRRGRSAVHRDRSPLRSSMAPQS